ncbi:MAG: hypothetical protein ACLFU2_04520 [Opitutales bacterium]
MAADSSARLWRGPTLVLDAATRRVHAGLLVDGTWAALEAPEGEALETIFADTSGVLARAGKSLGEVRHVALGIGPGSILGLRLALLAVNTWRTLPELAHWEVSTFHGLRLHAHLLAFTRGWDDFHLLSDFRRGRWHLVSTHGGVTGDLRLVEDAELGALSEDIHYTPTGRLAATPPAGAIETPFSLTALPALAPAPWTVPVTNGAPELYLPAPPAFQPWNAQRHR